MCVCARVCIKKERVGEHKRKGENKVGWVDSGRSCGMGKHDEKQCMKKLC